MFEKFFRRAFFGIFLLMPSLTLAEQVQLTPTLDTTLYEDDQGDLANGSGDYLFFGKIAESNNALIRRALMKFDVSAIPAEAIIESVTLTVEINNVPMVSPNGGAATLHRVTSAWGEGASDANGAEGQGAAAQANDATWLHRIFPGTIWSAPGGDFNLTASASEGYGVVHEILQFSSTPGLLQDVKAWVTNPASNNGWILLGNETVELTARRIYARESAAFAPPLLTIDYSIPGPTDNLVLTELTDGLSRPVVIANANDGTGRLFIVEQSGTIRIFDTNTQSLLAGEYLDISSIVDDSANEQGLLGLAFHPDFSSNRKFYVYYTRDPGPGSDRSVVAMYQQSLGNPNVADTNATVLMEFVQDSSNHNGGDMHFGIDGYLYIASGDGGGGNDSFNNGQNINTLKGKMLRIDVDSTPGGSELCGLVQNYAIPAGNAFPDSSDGCDEILHMGLRNPWKFSFDAQTEELYIGDVGQDKWEEIDYAAAGSPPLNFGWPCFEGSQPFRDDVTCPNAIDPIIEYSSIGGAVPECSVTGGYVYRGANTAIFGHYVFGDYCSDKIWVAEKQGASWNIVEWELAAPTLSSISAFGQDEQCELYVADLDAGKIYRIDDSEWIHRSGFETLRCQ